MGFRHVTLVLLAIASTSARSENSVALLPLVGEGLGADEIERVERTLQYEVDVRFGSRAVAAEAVRARLDAGSSQGLHCDRTRTPCMVQLGIVCRADLVILATLAPKGAASSLALRLVDVAANDQLAGVVGPVSAEPTHAEVAALLAQLEAPGAKQTRLLVRGPAGAAVVIDGHTVGALPVDEIRDLAPGLHDVAVIGAVRHAIRIDVRRGELTEVDVPSSPQLGMVLPPQNTALLPWVGVAGGGSAVVAGSIALALGLWPRVAWADAADRLQKIDAEVGTDRSALAARQDEVRTTRQTLDDNAAAWARWGAPLALGGAVVVAVGTVAAGAGAAGLIE